jgi:cytochrome c oxidase cbb3-type subunit 3
MQRFSACMLFLLSCIGSIDLQAQSDLNERLLLASPGGIAADTELSTHMNTLAEAAASQHCAACHGADLQGKEGVPNLVDYEWLWGVTGMEMTAVEPVMQIMQTILYGVRDTNCDEATKRYGACPDTRFSEMPGYGTIGFTEQQVDDLVEYVLSLAGEQADTAALARVAGITALCAECHGEDGYGVKQYGGPDLTDAVWLYGSSREQIRDVIFNGRKGVCPPWAERLDAATVKALAVYLYNKSMGL